MPNSNREEYNQYMRKYLLERFHKRMAEVKEHLGGKCCKCGSTEDLEIDHIDRTQKSFTVAKGWSYNKELFWAEVAKCQLLCQKCHNIKTAADLGQTPARGTHGTLSAYRYCKCDLCKKVHTDYCREWKRNRKKKGDNASGSI